MGYSKKYKFYANLHCAKTKITGFSPSTLPLDIRRRRDPKITFRLIFPQYIKAGSSSSIFRCKSGKRRECLLSGATIKKEL
jgi:hypothetical protein